MSYATNPPRGLHERVSRASGAIGFGRRSNGAASGPAAVAVAQDAGQLDWRGPLRSTERAGWRTETAERIGPRVGAPASGTGGSDDGARSFKKGRRVLCQGVAARYTLMATLRRRQESRLQAELRAAHERTRKTSGLSACNAT